MAKAAAGDSHYIKTGQKTTRSGERGDTEAGRLAAYIIDQIPEGYNVYEDHDINEDHLAKAIVETCGRYIRCCPQIGWMVYFNDEGRWTEEYAEPAVQEVIRHFGNRLLEGAKKTRPEEGTFARHILSAGGISAIKRILRFDTAITIEQDRFDAAGDWVNCRGDLYNLRTGDMRPSQPEDLLTQSTMCKAVPLKKASEKNLAIGKAWEAPETPRQFSNFLKKITSNDGADREDLALYLMSYFGYCLTGDSGASFFVNFHGEGNNGKSQLLMLMLKLFGSYGMALPKDIVIENKFASQFNLAGLPGKRLAVLIDAPDGRLNMDVLKSIVSGEEISAQRKFMSDINFSPVCKIAVGSNHKLKLSDTGMGVQRRVRMVPFDYKVPENEIIANFSKKLLKDEGPLILAWLIYFAHEYYRNGEGPKAFPPCAVVDDASKEYMKSQDLVGRWKEERTEAAEGSAASADDLYADFKKWAGEENIHKVMAKNTFGEHLAAHVKEKKRINSKWHYIGIKLKGETGSLPDGRGG